MSPPKKRASTEGSARKEYKAKHRAESRAAGRDIGEIPEPADPARRESCRLDLLRFLMTYLAARFPLAFSDDHLRVIASLQAAILQGGQFALAMPRGSGKTTICEGASLWAQLYGHRQFIFIVASDGPAAESIFEGLRTELEHNELIGEDFPDAVYPIHKLGGIARRAEGQTSERQPTMLVWTKKEVRLPRFAAGGGSVIRAAGITGRIRGAKASLADGSQVRPDLVLVDDPQTDESARSPSQVQTRFKTMTSTILGLAGPGKKIACFATVTVIERNDLADRILDRKEHPEWQGYRARMMRSLPTDTALWDKYADVLKEALRTGEGLDAAMATASAFYAEHRAAMDAGAEAAWPERVSDGELSAIQHAMDIRIMRGDAAFQAEYQNEPIDGTTTNLTQITPPLVLRKINQHERGIVPSEDTVLTASIDIQGKALYWMICGWSPGFGGDIIDYGCYPDQGRSYFTIKEVEKTMELAHPGASWEAALYASLEALVSSIMGRVFDRDDGGIASVEQLIIDAGYGDSTDPLFHFLRRSTFRASILPYFGRCIAPGATPMDQYKKKPGDRVGPGWRIPKPGARQTRHLIGDANRWKSFVADRLLSPMGAAGSLGLFGTSGAQHRMLADHLAAETRTQVSANGRVSDRWQLKPNHENHLLDNLSMAAIGASVRGVKLDEQAATPTAQLLNGLRAISRAVASAPSPRSSDGGTITTTRTPTPITKPAKKLAKRGGGFLDGFGFGGLS